MVQNLHFLFTCIHKHMIPYVHHKLHDYMVLVDLLSRTIYILPRDKYNSNIHAEGIAYIFSQRIVIC